MHDTYWANHLHQNHNEDSKDNIEAMLKRVDVPVKAVLGTSQITVNDFMNLQVGDCIRLDARVDSDMNIYVGNIKKFTALPGASDDCYAVRVTSVIREEE